jgi:hypothetical protein
MMTPFPPSVHAQTCRGQVEHGRGADAPRSRAWAAAPRFAPVTANIGEHSTISGRSAGRPGFAQVAPHRVTLVNLARARLRTFPG